MGWNDLIGARLGDYLIEAEIARGGMSRVYRARNAVTGGDAAIKVMASSADSSDSRGFSRRFEHEARAVLRLDHPNIVRVFDTDQTDEFVYIAMQLVMGGTYRSRLGKPLSIAEACSMAVQMAQALDHAHRHDIIHRDVKPANMLIDDRDPHHLLLADFGIAKIIGQKGVTKTGTAVGTPEYMAPEQAKGEEIDPRADIYGLACVLYESLAGRPPFVGPTALSICYQHVHTRPAYVRGFNPEVPRALALIIEEALAKNPNDRFPTAAAFAEALHPFIEPTDKVIRRSRPLTTPLSQLDLRESNDDLNLQNHGDRGTPGLLVPPPFMPVNPPGISIPPMGEEPVHPSLDLSQLPDAARVPTQRGDDMTARKTQEMLPMAEPAHPRITHPTPSGPRFKSHPLTHPRPSMPDVAELPTHMTPVSVAVGTPDIADRGTVQTPIAAPALGGDSGRRESRPVRRPSEPLPRPLPHQFSSGSRWRLPTIVVAVLGVALLAFLIISHLSNNNQGNSGSSLTSVGTSQPTTTAATATSVGPTATSVGPTATATINTMAALAIPRATLTNGPDLSCSANLNRTTFPVGSTVYLNICIAAGYGPGHITVTVTGSDGTILKTGSATYDVPNAAATAYYHYAPSLQADTYTVTVTWNGDVAQRLVFIVH